MYANVYMKSFLFSSIITSIGILPSTVFHFATYMHRWIYSFALCTAKNYNSYMYIAFLNFICSTIYFWYLSMLIHKDLVSYFYLLCSRIFFEQINLFIPISSDKYLLFPQFCAFINNGTRNTLYISTYVYVKVFLV